jgi:hypothetical protein
MCWLSISWVTWQVVTGVEHYSNTHCLMGLWSTSAKVQGSVPKAAWHWGSNTSVLKNPFGEPGHIPLYLSLPSARGSMDGACLSCPMFCGKAPKLGTPTSTNE